jgi:hypothetical protein
MAIENLQTDFIFEIFISDIRFRKIFANLLIKKGWLNRYTQVWGILPPLFCSLSVSGLDS